jgi:hypothetical protein
MEGRDPAQPEEDDLEKHFGYIMSEAALAVD